MILSRNGRDFTSRFLEIRSVLLTVPCRSAIIDGEVVACRADSTPDFRALHSGNYSQDVLCVWCFDLMELNGEDLRLLPLIARKQREIVDLVRARKIPRHKIAARYRLSVSTISSIAIKHGGRSHVKTPAPKKLRAASDLINRGMPLTHVARTVSINIQTLRRILEDEGLYVRSLPTPLWTEEEVCVLRRDYGKPGLTVGNIASKLGRTPNQVMLKARLLGLKWPLKLRANLGREPVLTDRQQAEARRRLAAGESARSIDRGFKVHPTR